VNGTSFVGRERELAELPGLLSRVRLVTVTGVGGVGKTRLARLVSAQVRAGFPDGVCFVGLSALNDPGLLPNSVAAALGLPEQDTPSAWDALLGYLQDRQLLLVLDTCEHLLDACAEVTEALLREAPGVTVLATSRQPLDVAGETSFPLSPLDVPAQGTPPRRGDAVDLFARRAAMAMPTFAVTDGNADDVIELCRRLDGIPLAIELAAVQLRTLPLKDLASAIPVEATARRDNNQRHQTLDAAIAWSYDLCTPAEKALWERLSVFAGPFGITAAEQVCAGKNLPRADVLPTIISLVDKSVLARDTHVSQGAPVRYRLLDTIRDFGRRKLAASGTEAGVHGRLAARYHALGTYFSDHVLDDDQLDRFRELRDEHESIRVALERSLGGPQAAPEPQAAELLERGTQLALSLFFYWHVAGLYHEGIYWLDKILGQRPEPSPERARALAMRCALATPTGVGSEAITDGHEAMRLAAGLGEARTAARSALFSQHALIMAGRLGEADRQTAATDRRLTQVQDRIGLAIHTVYMTNLHHLTGNLGASLEWYERGILMLGQGKERWLSSWLNLLGGFTLAQLGRLDEAAAAWKYALGAKLELGDIAGIAYGLEAFAFMASLDGRHQRAGWLGGAADPLWERSGVRLGGNPLFEELHDGYIANGRLALGAGQFEKVFDAGRVLPADQAVALAIGDADAPLQPLGCP
jgi:non-specific serine/threonine protein kinase